MIVLIVDYQLVKHHYGKIKLFLIVGIKVVNQLEDNMDIKKINYINLMIMKLMILII